MKKILILVVIFSSFFILKGNVNAESFVEGNFINGEYISKVKDNKTYYMTMQFIKDSQGRIVYCLEPFVDFREGEIYEEHDWEILEYNNLTNDQKRTIELILYYGYGYGNRKEDKWYVVTQYLLWQVVDSDSDIYFTKTLNGKKIDKYKDEIEAIMYDVSTHDIKPNFVKDYIVDYGDNLIINELNGNYEIISSNIDYYQHKDYGFQIDMVRNSGEVMLRKASNYYKNNVVIYDSINSQDLIRPGNVNNPIYSFNIDVKKGNVTIDIRKSEGVYTVESSLRDTCYEIKSEDEKFKDKVCTGEDELIYTTFDLPYGEYSIEQVSVGVGYKKDETLYKLMISSDDENPYLILNNLLIKNFIDIVKYECINDNCVFESGAVFEVKDKDGNHVIDLITDEEGFAYCKVGYGTYEISQIKGKDGYTLNIPYKEKVVDEDTMHRKELYDYFIKEESDSPSEEVTSNIVNEIPDVIEEILPPDTKVDFFRYDVILGAIFLVVFLVKKII